ncbi:hypothetical protein [Ferruginibacter profundus]
MPDVVKFEVSLQNIKLTAAQIAAAKKALEAALLNSVLADYARNHPAGPYVGIKHPDLINGFIAQAFKTIPEIAINGYKQVTITK